MVRFFPASFAPQPSVAFVMLLFNDYKTHRIPPETNRSSFDEEPSVNDDDDATVQVSSEYCKGRRVDM